MSTRTALAEGENEPQWLSTKEAAQLLGIGVRHLYRLIDEGHIPDYKLGRVIRLIRREVLAYRENGNRDASD